MYSALVKSTKNQFTIRLPFVAADSRSHGGNNDSILLEASKFATALYNKATFLGPIKVLLTILTNSKNAPFDAVPVTYVTVPGFTNNVKISRYSANFGKKQIATNNSSTSAPLLDKDLSDDLGPSSAPRSIDREAEP